MTQRIANFLYIFSVIAGIKGEIDLTLVPRSKGFAVVEAVHSKLSGSKIFPDDNRFLKRSALVVTNFGMSATTFTRPSSGGIWKVSASEFEASKISNSSNMTKLMDEILLHFGIDWTETSYEDLEKPLYSGLANKMYLASLNEKIPDTIESQASFWRKNFDFDISETNFIRKISKWEEGIHCSAKLNLLIVLDGSSSVSGTNFATAKDFVSDLISNFDLKFVTIGFITYSDRAEIVIPFSTHESISSMKREIKNADFSTGGTQTHLAIDTAISMFQSSSDGSRVLIVMTDGKSHDHSLTVESANYAQENNIMTFSIGIGNSTSETELIDIAGGEISRVIQVSSFNALTEMTHRVNKAICYVSCDLPTNSRVTDTILQGEIKFYKYNRNCSETNVKVGIKSGRIVGYYSLSFPNPSSAIHDGAMEDGTTIVPFPANEKACYTNIASNYTSALYISIIGVNRSNEFTIEFQGSNLPRHRVDLSEVAKANGYDVVELVASKIHQSKIFVNDNGFLKRMAFVESNYGMNSETDDTTPSGGIWKVSPEVFIASKKINSPVMVDVYDAILRHFNIDWKKTTYKDLDKPLYSILAVKIYLHSLRAKIPDTIDGQANFWKTKFNKRRYERTFAEEIKNLEKEGYLSTKLDLVIILDGFSGDYSYSSAAKGFIEELISKFDLSSVRIGFITSGNKASTIIPLRNGQDLESITKRIIRANSLSDGGKIYLAIDEAISIFDKSTKTKVPRVIVALTDGQSDNQILTKASANRAKENDITIFSIGFGRSTSLAELVGIAGGESNRVIEVTSTNGLREVARRLTDAISNIPYVLPTNKPETMVDTLRQNETTFYAYDCYCTQNNLKIEFKSGRFFGYYSAFFPNPSSAIHDGIIENGTFFAPNPDDENRCFDNEVGNSTCVLYISLTGVDISNEFSIDVKDNTIPRVGGSVDETLVPNAFGIDVVEMVDAKIAQSNIFSGGNDLLKPLAYVATNFGRNSTVQQTAGGIWKVPRDVFEELQRKNTPKMISLKKKVKKYFGIHLEEAKYDDCKIPIFCGIVTQMYFESLNQNFQNTIEAQAEFLEDNFDLNGPVAEELKIFEGINNPPVRFDLVIVLDSSDSLGADNFALAKDFVDYLLSKFDLSSVRFGFVTYSDKAEIIIPLGEFRSRAAVTRNIKNAINPGSGKNTHLGIDTAISMFNSSDSNNVPRVLIVISVGEFHRPDLTIASSQIAKDKNVTTFSIGIGNKSNRQELDAISGNEPSRVIHVPSFDALAQITQRVSKEIRFICMSYKIATNTPTPVTLKQNETKYLTYTRNCSETDLKIELKSGTFIGYYSYSFHKPSSALHDGTFQHGNTFIPNPDNKTCSNELANSTRNIYITLVGIGDSNAINIDLRGSSQPVLNGTLKPGEDLNPIFKDVWDENRRLSNDISELTKKLELHSDLTSLVDSAINRMEKTLVELNNKVKSTRQVSIREEKLNEAIQTMDSLSEMTSVLQDSQKISSFLMRNVMGKMESSEKLINGLDAKLESLNEISSFVNEDNWNRTASLIGKIESIEKKLGDRRICREIDSTSEDCLNSNSNTTSMKTVIIKIGGIEKKCDELHRNMESSRKKHGLSCSLDLEAINQMKVDIQSLQSIQNSIESNIKNGTQHFSRSFPLLKAVIWKAIQGGAGCPPSDLRINSQPVTSCYILRQEEGILHNGVYVISPLDDNEINNQKRSVSAYCDMESYGGGWTVFQRRGSPEDNSGTYRSDSFNRNWAEYKVGFGDPNYDYWLGLATIHKMTKDCNHELLITAKSLDGTTYKAHYSVFSVASEGNNFMLTVDDYQAENSTLLDSLKYVNGRSFSTSDRNSETKTSCSNEWTANGFWFNTCFNVNLNGVYPSKHHPNSISTTSWEGIVWQKNLKLKRTEMKIRQKCGKENIYRMLSVS